ncbi:MAG: hypothetical protein IJZ13_02750, partial [Clostridia bacterium]|nr:hypothetical protein [Clostridia bacterium]
VYEACPFCNEATNLCTDSSYTKSDVIEKLRYVGFTDAEIDKCLEDYDDSYFYNESDYKKP